MKGQIYRSPSSRPRSGRYCNLSRNACLKPQCEWLSLAVSGIQLQVHRGLLEMPDTKPITFEISKQTKRQQGMCKAMPVLITSWRTAGDGPRFYHKAQQTDNQFADHEPLLREFLHQTVTAQNPCGALSCCVWRTILSAVCPSPRSQSFWRRSGASSAWSYCGGMDMYGGMVLFKSQDAAHPRSKHSSQLSKALISQPRMWNNLKFTMVTT